jgi:hypothetical protein
MQVKGPGHLGITFLRESPTPPPPVVVVFLLPSQLRPPQPLGEHRTSLLVMMRQVS